MHLLSRRHVLSVAALSFTVPPSPRSRADVLAPVAPGDTLAKGLDYHGNRNQVDTTQYPEFDVSQQCANCQHFTMHHDQAGHSDQTGCKLMPGRQIDPDGWCKVWTERSG